MDVISACDAEAVAVNRGSCSRLLCLYSLRLRKHSSVIVTRHRMTFRGILGVQTQVGFFSNYTVSLNQGLMPSRSRMIQADSRLHTVTYMCLLPLNTFLAMTMLAVALAASLQKFSVIDDLDHPNRAGKTQTRSIPTSARFPP